MKVELPQFKRCCCCLPLRKGLIGWGYLNLVLNAMAVIYFVYLLSVEHEHILYDVVSVLTVFVIVQASFNILLVIVSHKKSAKLLRVSFIYCIFIAVLMLIADAYGIYSEMYYILKYWEYYNSISRRIISMFYTLAPVFLQTFVQVYLALLIRSEMIKLRHAGIDMQFVNNAAEREAYASAVQPLPSEQQSPSNQEPVHSPSSSENLPYEQNLPSDQDLPSDQHSPSGQHLSSDQHIPSGQHLSSDQHIPSDQYLPSDQHLPSGDHLSSDLSPSGQSPSSGQNRSIWPALPPVKDED